MPPRVFGQEFINPVSGDPGRLRSNLKAALDLFRKAGYELKNNRMTNVKTGQAFSFEILLNGPIIEKVALPFAKNLKLIGIDVSVRTVDPSQFTNRWRTRDYDVIYQGWNQSLNPGNEQAEYWGSKSANIEGSQNYAGIADPAIDKLIDKVIFAPNRNDQIAATHALDRVLLANHYVIPSYTLRKSASPIGTGWFGPSNCPPILWAFRKSGGWTRLRDRSCSFPVRVSILAKAESVSFAGD